MGTQNEDQRPITIGDIKKIRKSWLQQSSTGSFYLGLFLIAVGFLSLFIPETNGTFMLPLTIVSVLFGLGGIALSFWAKNQIKKF